MRSHSIYFKLHQKSIFEVMSRSICGFAFDGVNSISRNVEEEKSELVKCLSVKEQNGFPF